MVLLEVITFYYLYTGIVIIFYGLYRGIVIIFCQLYTGIGIIFYGLYTGIVTIFYWPAGWVCPGPVRGQAARRGCASPGRGLCRPWEGRGGQVGAVPALGV